MLKRERERDFDREKVGALDREASREGGTIGSSPCRLDSRRERDSRRGSRDSAFSERVFRASLQRLQSNVVLYLLPLYRTENLTNGLLSTCVPDARGKSLYPIRGATYLSAPREIFAHLLRKRDQFISSVHPGAVREK